MKRSAAIVDSSYFLPVVEYLQQHHADQVESIFQCANVHYTHLQTKKCVITQQQYCMIMEAVLAIVDGSAFMLYLVDQAQMTHHGLLGLATLCGLTLKHALNTVIRFYKLRTKLVHLEWVVKEDQVFFRISPACDLGKAEQFTIQMALWVILKAKQESIGIFPGEDKMHSAYANAYSMDQLEENFGVKVEYHQPSHQLVFPARHLKIKLKGAHQETYEVLSQQCEQSLLVLDKEDDLVSKLRVLLQESEDKLPSLEVAAKALLVSSRSLSRHLKQVGLSYQQLLDEERIRQAKSLLLSSELSVTDIAMILHFSDSSHLTKFFKRYVGKTPKQFRTEQTTV